MIEINAIEKDKPSEHLELTDHIIRRPGGLTSLNTPNPHSHMRTINHIDIIGPIANGKRMSPLLNNAGDF